jgi:ATP-dependent Lhr-like helicase
VDADPVVHVERGGKGLVTLVPAGDARIARALAALAQFVLAGRGPKLGIEKVDGEPVVGSAFEPMLIELGFRGGPRRLTLSA